MSCAVCTAVVTIALIVLGVKLKKFWDKFWYIPPIPQLQEKWWGSGEAKTVDETIKPFKISISQEMIDDLQQRLIKARPFTPPLEGVQQQYGMNTQLLEQIVQFWKTEYDWRKREAFLNGLPQFKTNIQGLDIHFLHVKPKNVNKLPVLPLLLLHGWPGSVREFYEIIPMLTEPDERKQFVFEVIAPSLPGFGFSTAASKKGLSPVEMSLIFKNLMIRLGFNKFYVQGGDWGGLIASHMATLFPNEILGAHMNLTGVRNHPMVKIKMLLKSLLPIIFSSEKEKKMMAKSGIFFSKEMGYYSIQSTKPDTVGVALNDSPVGLAAYILEKFTTWTNPDWGNRADGGLLQKYDYTKLLDNVMIYWVTNSITTSCRIYYENSSEEVQKLQMDIIPVTVPTAISKFEHELYAQPDDILKHKYVNLLHSSEIADGGHFAAFEVPEVLARDMWEAFGKMHLH